MDGCSSTPIRARCRATTTVSWGASPRRSGYSPMLTEAQKQALVDLARRSVVEQVTYGRSAPVPLDVGLPAASGAFVTIKRRGQLRGCLGTLECRGGLAGEVARCAADAASEDPRFPSVAGEELPGLDGEGSVLGPLGALPPDPSHVVVGRHG